MALSPRDWTHIRAAVAAGSVEVAAQRFIDHTMLAGGDRRTRAIELVSAFVQTWQETEAARERSKE